MKKLINNIKKKNKRIVILTAREYWYIGITKKWLSSCNIGYDLLVVVPNPSKKIELLSAVNFDCIYYDDMSFNHEKGKVLYYKKEINDILKMKNIKYFDYVEIQKINKNINDKNFKSFI